MTVDIEFKHKVSLPDQYHFTDHASYVEDYEEYFIPYYKFYVELPQEEQDNGLKTYGIYYVPAVEGQYISYKGNAYFN